MAQEGQIMIKLKNILTEKKELGGAMINVIDRLTDSNNHNEARLQLAKSFLGKNSPLVKGYESLISLHNLLGDMNTLMKAREKMDKMLFNGAKRGGSFDTDSVEYEDDRWNNDSKMLKRRDKKLGQWEKKVNKALNGLMSDYVKAWK